MKKFSVILINLLIVNSSFSQKIIKEINRPAYKNAFYIRPLNAVDYSHPRISIGYERMLEERKFLSLTTSLYYTNFYDANQSADFRKIPYMPTKGIGLELEHKWFQKSLFYYAASLSVRQIKYQAQNIFILKRPDGTSSESLDFFNARKQWIEASGKLGWRVRPSERLFLDFYLGVGIRYKHTWYTDTDSPDGATIEKVFNLYYFRDRPGHFLVPTAKGGVTFGYKF
jgi:hypothetical protein